MKEKKVSVVIPTLNRAYCLENTIRSVLDQTYRNVEVLIVDDGSNDGTGELVSRLQSEDDRVKYVWKPNGGVANARNFGFNHITGDYMALLDSDDTWMPWKLELQVSCLERFPMAGMIWSDMEAIDNDDHITPNYLRKMYTAWHWWKAEEIFNEVRIVNIPDSDYTAKLYVGNIFSQMIMGSLVHTSTVLMTRKRLAKVVEFNENFRCSGEDYDFHLRTCKAGQVAFIDVPTIQYRIGAADQLSHPEYLIYTSENFLATILPFITNERETINLSDHMINTILAEAYAWIGTAQLEYGDPHIAAKNFLMSLRYNQLQPRVAVMMLLALLPKNTRTFIRKGVSGLKNKLTA